MSISIRIYITETHKKKLFTPPLSYCTIQVENNIQLLYFLQRRLMEDMKKIKESSIGLNNFQNYIIIFVKEHKCNHVVISQTYSL